MRVIRGEAQNGRDAVGRPGTSVVMVMPHAPERALGGQCHNLRRRVSGREARQRFERIADIQPGVAARAEKVLARFVLDDLKGPGGGWGGAIVHEEVVVVVFWLIRLLGEEEAGPLGDEGSVCKRAIWVIIEQQTTQYKRVVRFSTPRLSVHSFAPSSRGGSPAAQSQRGAELALPLLQLGDWDPRIDNEPIPTCIHYSIEWKLQLKKGRLSTLTGITEENLALTPSAYRDKFLKQALATRVQDKLPESKYQRDETKITYMRRGHDTCRNASFVLMPAPVTVTILDAAPRRLAMFCRL